MRPFPASYAKAQMVASHFLPISCYTYTYVYIYVCVCVSTVSIDHMCIYIYVMYMYMFFLTNKENSSNLGG